ncbi:LysR family transcriptional regulator [Hwanghaeella grinnelliae]|uniref:LysR family transcriptional regulator n=1 Tax=Hwanghaeella grinnelliae TaxID=2500179 RepID=A0A437QXF7_9PROT|nr:LysR family transcriptional regulator [Hwanghaeella grinnelliae]RVU39217.1 LysR family transcriptional regulator [Hwanghaeella grinnelliae]
MNDELRILDLRTFSSVADTLSFTRTGDTLGATQSAVSLRIQRLEKQVDRRLLARTPRGVALTPDGADFLSEARRLLDQHDALLRRTGSSNAPTELKLGISDHFAGNSLPSILAHLNRAVPDLRLDVEIAETASLFSAFEDGAYDAVILRELVGESPPKGKAAGIVHRLEAERLRWFAQKDFVWPNATALPVATHSPRCLIRAASLNALDKAGITWRDAFTGGGIGTLRAAVTAGLGVTCLGEQNRPDDSRDVTEEFALPLPGSAAFTLMIRSGMPLSKAQTSAVIAAFKRSSR